MDREEKRRKLTATFLQDRNLKVTDDNKRAMKGTLMEFELKQIFKENNCL